MRYVLQDVLRGHMNFVQFDDWGQYWAYLPVGVKKNPGVRVWSEMAGWQFSEQRIRESLRAELHRSLSARIGGVLETA